MYRVRKESGQEKGQAPFSAGGGSPAVDLRFVQAADHPSATTIRAIEARAGSPYGMLHQALIRSRQAELSRYQGTLTRYSWLRSLICK